MRWGRVLGEGWCGCGSNLLLNGSFQHKKYPSPHHPLLLSPCLGVLPTNTKIHIQYTYTCVCTIRNKPLTNIYTHTYTYFLTYYVFSFSLTHRLSSHTHIYTYTYIHTLIHTHTYTRIHTHTHYTHTKFYESWYYNIHFKIMPA